MRLHNDRWRRFFRVLRVVNLNVMGRALLLPVSQLRPDLKAIAFSECIYKALPENFPF